MAVEGEKVFRDNGEIDKSLATIAVENEHSLYLVRSKALELGKSVGMEEKSLGELEIIVRELVNNVLAHGGGKGFVKIGIANGGNNQTRMVINVVDRGKGFKNFKEAIKKGKSTSGSLGEGLPRVKKLSDKFELVSSKSTGSHLRVEKRVLPLKIADGSWEITFSTRMYPDETINGDGFSLFPSTVGPLIVVCDGIGHGSKAAEAVRKALDIVKTNKDQPLLNILELLDTGLARTRGAAISMVRLLPDKREIEWLGVGNVVGSFFNSADTNKYHKTFMNASGIVGMQVVAPQLSHYRYKPGTILAINSDGIKKNWFKDFDETIYKSLREMGEEIVRDYGLVSDDATILLGRFRK